MSKNKLEKLASAAIAEEPRFRDARQSAEVQLQLGSTGRLAARVDVTSGGLLAIGGMVSMMLLASAAIVRAARRH